MSSSKITRNQIRKQDLAQCLELLIQERDFLRESLSKLEDLFNEIYNDSYDIKEELEPDSELLIIKKDFSLNKQIDKLDKFDYLGSLEETIAVFNEYCEHEDSIIEELQEFFRTPRVKRIP